MNSGRDSMTACFEIELWHLSQYVLAVARSSSPAEAWEIEAAVRCCLFAHARGIAFSGRDPERCYHVEVLSADRPLLLPNIRAGRNGTHRILCQGRRETQP